LILGEYWRGDARAGSEAHKDCRDKWFDSHRNRHLGTTLDVVLGS
jgi:hypothetical protein